VAPPEKTPSDTHGCGTNFFLYKNMGAERGAGIKKLQQKNVFSRFWLAKNKFHDFLPPLEKLLKKSTTAPTGKNPSDAHAHNKRVKLRHFCCITPYGNTVQQHQCGKQAIAGWHTVHGVFCQTITKFCQITKNILQIILAKYWQNSAFCQ